MSNASSEYTDAKPTRPESTVYHTAPEASLSTSEDNPFINSRSNSNDSTPSAAVDEHRFPTDSPLLKTTPIHQPSTPSTRSIRSLERLRDGGQSDPQPTDFKNPTSSSLSPRLQHAFAYHNIEDVEAEGFALSGPVSTAVEDAHMHNRIQAKNKHRVPKYQCREGMALLVTSIRHESYRMGNCSRREWKLASDPPKVIAETDLRPEKERVKASSTHRKQFPEHVERSRLLISPHASRSATLAKLVKQQDVPPHTNAKKNFYVRRSLCVTRMKAPKVGESEWRLCTYEELTWIEMMDQLNEESIEEGFRGRFGWKIPKEWVVLVNKMHKDPMFFKRKYLGWTPDAVSWKHRVGT